MLRGAGGGQDDESEEWTAEGTLAHYLGAHCLEADIPAKDILGRGGEWEAVDEKMVRAVQAYLDYVHSRPGRMLVEHRFHRPEIHRLFYGTADTVKYAVQDNFLEIIDYKHGAGVLVEVKNNPQLMYYALGVLFEDIDSWPLNTVVRLTIVQPNSWHEEGRIRYWETTVGALLSWMTQGLVPAMNNTQALAGWFFSMGEHCRFCPAKLACPAMHNLVNSALVAAKGVSGTEKKPEFALTWRPKHTLDEIKIMLMYAAAYRKWAYRELMNGANPKEVGAKLEVGRANRIWKDGAQDALSLALGKEAFEVKLKSPNQIEEQFGEGLPLVAEWAFKPPGAATVVPLSSKGSAVKNTASSQFKSLRCP